MQIKRLTFISITRAIACGTMLSYFLAAPALAQDVKAGDLVITQASVMTMRPLDNGLAIEPGKTVKLAPGGYHLMLFDLKSPLKQGDKVPLTLEFEKAGKVKVSFDVQGVGAQGPTTSPSSGSKKDMKGMSPGMKM
jgi:hypothetical protein